MINLDDMCLWLESSRSLLGNAKSWGLYVADAQRWPERRDEVKIQAKRAMFTLEQEQRRAEETISQAESKSSDQFINVSVAKEPTLPHCDRCNNFGVLGGFSGRQHGAIANTLVAGAKETPITLKATTPDVEKLD